jgi:hypothetical protein
MPWLDWLLPAKPKVVREALDGHAAAARRLLAALRAGAGMTLEQSMDDLRDAFDARRNGNGNGNGNGEDHD